MTDFEMDDGEPIEQVEDRYTGNAGMTIEYWYHYGAVILWPKSQHADIINELSVSVRLKWVEYYVKKFEDTTLEPLTYLEKIVNGLADENVENFSKYYRENFNSLAEALIKLDDIKILRKVNLVLVEVFDKIDLTKWTNLLDHFEIMSFSNVFNEIGESREIIALQHLLNLLHHLSTHTSPKIITFVGEQIKNIPAYLQNTSFTEMEKNYDYSDKTKWKDRIQQILERVILLSQHEEVNDSWVARTVTGLTKLMTRKYVNESLVPVLLKSKATDNALKNELLDIAIQDLESRTEVKPIPPVDWQKKVPQSSRWDSIIWDLLTPFLTSPTQQVFDYQAIKNNRKNMENAIGNVDIELEMTTLITRPAHTLRLTKTNSAHLKELKRWEKDLKLLAELK